MNIKKSLFLLATIPALLGCNGNQRSNPINPLDPISDNNWQTAFSKFDYNEKRNYKVNLNMESIAYMEGTKQESAMNLTMNINGFNKASTLIMKTGESTSTTKLYSKKIDNFVWHIRENNGQYNADSHSSYGDSEDMYISSFCDIANLKSQFKYIIDKNCYRCVGVCPLGPTLMVSYSDFYFDAGTQLLKKIVCEAGEKFSAQEAYMYMEYNFSDYGKTNVSFPFSDDDVSFSEYRKEIKKQQDEKIKSKDFSFSIYDSTVYKCDLTGVFKDLKKISVKKTSDSSYLQTKINKAYIYLDNKLLEENKDYYINKEETSVLIKNKTLTPTTKLDFKFEYDKTSSISETTYMELE